MANDGISMRSITRTASSVSSRDAGQISGNNQSLNGLLDGAGDNGFQRMLDVQVQRKPAPEPVNTARKDGRVNDKARRPGGNNSPPASASSAQVRAGAAQSGSESAKARVQSSHKDARSAQRQEQVATERRTGVRSDARRETGTPASSGTKHTANNMPGVDKPVTGNQPEGGVNDEGAALDERVQTPVANQTASAEGTLDTPVAEVSAASGISDEPVSDAAPANVATEAIIDPLVVGQVLTLETPLPIAEITVNIGGADDVSAADQTVVRVDGSEPLSQAAAANIDPNEVIPTPSVSVPTVISEVVKDENGVAQAVVMASAPARLSPGNVTPNTVTPMREDPIDSEGLTPLLSGVAVRPDETQTEDLPDPALKDLLTAMIRNRDQANASPARVGNDTYAGPASDATKSSQQTLTAVARELSAVGNPPAAIPVTAVESAPLAELVSTASFGEITTEQGQTETMTLSFEDSESMALLQDAVLEDAVSEDAVSEDAESLTDLADPTLTLTKPFKPSSVATPAIATTPSAEIDGVSAFSTDVETESESWSLLDEVAVAPEDVAHTKMANAVQQQEQQIALVRNELRNLERFVDGGAQGMTARSVERKEEKANDIKPAALSRALDNLGAGSKTADLRPGVTVSNTPVAFGRQGFAEQMAEKIMLMTTQKVQVAEIRLDPKEMGTIDVKIRVHQDQASVVFSSPNPQVREALETSLPRLREMFADAGVGLGSVNVNDRGSSSGSNEQSSGRGEGRAFAGVDDAVEERSPKTPRQPNGLVDYYA